MTNSVYVMMHPVELANPYIPQLVSGLRAAGARVEAVDSHAMRDGSVDVLHLHWPEGMATRSSLLASLRGMGLLLRWLFIAQRSGTAVVWTVHNARSHEDRRRWLEWMARTAVARSARAWISLTEAGVSQVTRANPALGRVPRAIIPHGHYRDAYSKPPEQAEARRAMGYGDDAIVVLYFGAIRPYKNVESLMRAFRDVPDQHWRLVIAGKAQASMDVELAELAEGDDRIQLMTRFVDAEEVPTLFAAADFAVLPFVETLNSGSTILASSMGCPVLVPYQPVLCELADVVGRDLIRVYENELTAQTLLKASDQFVSQELESQPDLSSMDWAAISQQTLNLYQSVTSRSRHLGGS